MLTHAERTARQRKASRLCMQRRRAKDPSGEHAILKAWFEANWFRKCVHAARAHVKARFKRTGVRLPCTITPEGLQQIFEQQHGCCYWTGIPLDQKVGSLWTASVDRLEIDQGYEMGNVVLASWFANRARNTMTAGAFKAALQRLFTEGRAP